MSSMWTRTGTGARPCARRTIRTRGARSAHFYSARAYAFTPLADGRRASPPAPTSRRAALQGDGEDAASTVALSLSTAPGAIASAPFAMTAGALVDADDGRGRRSPPAAPSTVTHHGEPAGRRPGARSTTSSSCARPPPAPTPPPRRRRRARRRARPRSLFSAASLAALDDAVEIAAVVLGRDAPAAAAVDDALAL